MNYSRIIDKAVAVNQQLINNMDADPEIIDFPLQQRASKLHNFFYSKAPAQIFLEYINAVHDRTGRPFWLCGKEGVNYILESFDKAIA